MRWSVRNVETNIRLTLESQDEREREALDYLEHLVNTGKLVEFVEHNDDEWESRPQD